MKTIFFDLDGTLVDSLPGIEFAVDLALALHRFARTAALVDTLASVLPGTSRPPVTHGNVYYALDSSVVSRERCRLPEYPIFCGLTQRRIFGAEGATVIPSDTYANLAMFSGHHQFFAPCAVFIPRHGSTPPC